MFPRNLLHGWRGWFISSARYRMVSRGAQNKRNILVFIANEKATETFWIGNTNIFRPELFLSREKNISLRILVIPRDFENKKISMLLRKDNSEIDISNVSIHNHWDLHGIRTLSDLDRFFQTKKNCFSKISIWENPSTKKFSMLLPINSTMKRFLRLILIKYILPVI